MLNNFTKYDLPKFGYIKIPRFSIPKEDRERLELSNNCSSEEYLLALAKEGYQNKLKSGKIPQDKKHTYWERISNELSEINKLFFTDYILLVYHVIKFCDNNGILNSPGRGSCGGSLLLYVLGVVKVSALQHDLLFERFISSGRTEVKEINGEKYIKSENLPDVDLDSDRELKYKINEFITSQFPNRTCQIKTVGTLQGKSAIKEVLKCYEEFNEDQAKEISNIIETRFGKVEQITDALSDDPKKTNEKFKEWAKEHEESVNISCKINGLFKNTSIHASGIIICEEELDNNIPTELSSNKEIVTCYDMEGSQFFGIKLDNLGLKNLTSIKECLGLIGKNMEDIDINDKSIYNFLQKSNDYRGIFQAEEGLGKMVMRKLQCKNIDDIGMSVAIGRPGSMKFLDEIIDVREGNVVRKIDERVRSVLNPTYNVIIFQEQIMALSRIMADFTPQESDGLRKGIGKKIKEKVLEYKDKFIKGSLKNKYEEEFIYEMWQTFEDSGDYLFNKSHAIQYGYLSAICAYLKANYPTEYFYSLLKNAKNETKPQEEISLITEELSRFGVELLGPHLIKSDIDFKIESKDSVRMGLGNVKGIADKSFEKLKNFCHEYSNKFQIFQAANECGINITVLSHLILAGTMDDYLTETRTQTCLEMQTWNILTPREQQKVLQLGEQFKFNLIEIIKYLSKPQEGSDKPFIKEKRLGTIRKEYKPYQLIHQQNSKNEELCEFWFEKSLLGFSYSHNLIDILNKEYDNVLSIEKAMAEIDDERVTVGGEIVEIRTGTSKNKNKYIKCLITDGSMSTNVMIMEKNFEGNSELNHGKKLEIGDLVLCSGRKKTDIVFCNKIVNQNVRIIQSISELKKKNK